MNLIQITDEMLKTFRDAWMKSMQEDPRTEDPERIADRAGLVAVMALVERDHAVGPAMCEEMHPTEWDAYCELPRGHADRGRIGHSATVTRALDWASAAPDGEVVVPDTTPADNGEAT